MRVGSILKLLPTVVFLLAPLQAGILTGANVSLLHYYPDSSSLWEDFGTITAPNSFDTGDAGYIVTVNDSNVVVAFYDTEGFSSAPFNGLVLGSVRT